MAADLFDSCPSKKKVCDLCLYSNIPIHLNFQVLVLPESADHNTFNLYNDILRPVASFIRNHCHGESYINPLQNLSKLKADQISGCAGSSMAKKISKNEKEKVSG